MLSVVISQAIKCESERRVASFWNGREFPEIFLLIDGDAIVPDGARQVGVKTKSGDRMGFEMDLDQGTVTFYKNGKMVGEVYRGMKEKCFPTVSVYSSGSVKPKVTITNAPKP